MWAPMEHTSGVKVGHSIPAWPMITSELWKWRNIPLPGFRRYHIMITSEPWKWPIITSDPGTMAKNSADTNRAMIFSSAQVFRFQTATTIGDISALRILL